jgi:hypothetical protein
MLEKYGKRLNAAPLRIQLSNIKPNIKKVCKEKRKRHSWR